MRHIHTYKEKKSTCNTGRKSYYIRRFAFFELYGMPLKWCENKDGAYYEKSFARSYCAWGGDLEWMGLAAWYALYQTSTYFYIPLCAPSGACIPASCYLWDIHCGVGGLPNKSVKIITRKTVYYFLITYYRDYTVEKTMNYWKKKTILKLYSKNYIKDHNQDRICSWYIDY